jgi:phosphoglycerate-specific signal transduction histidine kinase
MRKIAAKLLLDAHLRQVLESLPNLKQDTKQVPMLIHCLSELNAQNNRLLVENERLRAVNRLEPNTPSSTPDTLNY